MKHALLSGIAISLLLTCAATAQTDDPWAAMDWSQSRGANTIKGSAMLRTRGGEVRTCAGFPVRLLPSAPMTAKWVEEEFGTTSGGMSAARWRPKFGDYVRETTCDAGGNFQFEHLPDGRYYAIAQVQWDVAGTQQGGLIASRVTVADGQVRTITLTQ